MPKKIDVYVFPSKEARDFKQDGVFQGSASTREQLENLVEDIEERQADEPNYFWYFSSLGGWLSYREAEDQLAQKFQ